MLTKTHYASQIQKEIVAFVRLYAPNIFQHHKIFPLAKHKKTSLFSQFIFNSHAYI